MQHEKPFFRQTSYSYRSLFFLFIIWGQIVLSIHGPSNHPGLFAWYLGLMTCLTLLFLYKRGLSGLEKFEFFGNAVCISYPLRELLPESIIPPGKRYLELQYSRVTGIRYFSPGLNYYLKALGHSIPRPLFIKPGIHISFINLETKRSEGTSVIIYNKKKAKALLDQLKIKCPDIRIETIHGNL
jgi:hypothetical protein